MILDFHVGAIALLDNRDIISTCPPLQAYGATLVHPPVMTPWDDYNVRLQDPDGMQITLFQRMESKEDSSS